MFTFEHPIDVSRRNCLKHLGAAGVLAFSPLALSTQHSGNSVTLNIALEPDGLDPTVFAASACGQVVLYNILEGLVKITESGAVHPLLASSWQVNSSQTMYQFNLRPGVRFHDGAPMDVDCVIFSFLRAQARDSKNKAKKSVFDNIKRLEPMGQMRLKIELFNPDPNFLFRLGEATAVILHPDSVASAGTHPIGTGPYAFVAWYKGHSVVMRKAPTYRAATTIAIENATFRFINDMQEQAQALEHGEVDVFINFITHDLQRFYGDPRYQVLVGASSGKGMLAVNHRHPVLKDVRVRQAMTHAIDRQAFVAKVLQGKGSVIGSHFAPTDPGYLNLSHIYKYNPARAKELLSLANVSLPLNLTLTSLPVPYAREGGPLIAQYLEKVGIKVNIQQVTWREWLAQTLQGHFDLTLINHVEPLDHMIYADPQYYFGYDNADFRALAAQHAESRHPRERQLLYAAMQRYLAEDAANIWLFAPQVSGVARKGLQGLWMNYPIFTHDISALRWTS